MFRRDKWWHREIEKMRREHAAERAQLVAAIAHLQGRPLPTDDEPPADDPQADASPYELTQPDFH